MPRGVDVRQVEGLLAPGFIDVQVNGGGGVLFNDTPTVDGIRAIGAAHRKFGTTGFLPTLITDTREKMAAAVAAVRDGLAAGVPGLLGIHLEGPFLNPERKGVHDAKYMRPIEDEDIRIMTSLGAGRTLVTLAPEMVPMEAISRLIGGRRHRLGRAHGGELRDAGGGAKARAHAATRTSSTPCRR